MGFASNLSPMGTGDAMEFLIEKLKTTKNNEDFFESHKPIKKEALGINNVDPIVFLASRSA